MATPARTRTILIAVVAGAALALSACGKDSSPGDADSAAVQTAPNGDVFNEADVTFAESMIPHHAQAVQMVIMTQGRPLDPEVAALAEGIRDAQVPEIETMSDWLVAWGEEVPETSLSHSNADSGDSGMDGMGDSQMPDMMSPEQLAELQDAPDSTFQEMWIAMMIEHHRGAVRMAQSQQADGTFGAAVDLAAEIEAAQTEEIATMERLRG